MVYDAKTNSLVKEVQINGENVTPTENQTTFFDGSVIKQTEKAYLHQYSLATKDVDWLNPASKAADRPSQSSEVLFIEQAEQYLADGGYLAIVLPDGILTNSSINVKIKLYRSDNSVQKSDYFIK